MANEDLKVDTDGGVDKDDAGANAPSSKIDKKMIWKNVKDMVFKIKLDTILYYCICFLSLAIVPLAYAGGRSYYYSISMNRRPVSESLIEGLNCGNLNGTLGQSDRGVCSMDTFDTRYALFEKQVDYFHFAPTFGVSLCEDNGQTFSFLQDLTNMEYFGTEAIPQDIDELIGNNIGNCSHGIMLATEIFAALAMVFAPMGLLWFTVLSDYFESRATVVHVVLISSTLVSSVATVVLFSVAMNPLRPSIGVPFCEDQSAFRDCEESVGVGFYCQIAVSVLSFLQLLFCVMKSNLDTSMVLNCCGKDKEEDQAPKVVTHDHASGPRSHHPSFYKDVHFWVKLGRFLEFFLATVALLSSFTSLELLLPDSENTPIQRPNYLWAGHFCQEGFFATDLFLLENEVELKNFGDCNPFYTYKILFAFAKIVICGGMALFLKRDAAKNPLFYLGGLCADFGTIVLVCMAITLFMTKIYPGRSGIEPSFCDQYIEIRESLVEDVPTDTEVCNIEVGLGFVLLCVVLVLTVVNLIAEFIIGELGSQYGAINAFQTVVKRLRRGQYQDAMMKAASHYPLTVASPESKKETSEDADQLEEAPSSPVEHRE